jgi:hypothetical protein
MPRSKSLMELDDKDTRAYWRTMHKVVALFERMPMNERRAWVHWLESAFVTNTADPEIDPVIPEARDAAF